MAKIILNNTTEIPCDNVYERVVENQLTAVKTYFLEEGEDIPSIPVIQGKEVTSVSVVADDGTEIPIACEYSEIKDYSTNYSERDKTFSYSLLLG